MILLTQMALAGAPAEGSVWHFHHRITTEASPEAVWDVWTDVGGWPAWDTGLDEASLDGPLRLGATGTLVSAGRTQAFEVVSWEPGTSYAFATTLPAGTLVVTRTLELRDGQTTFEHDVRFRGFGGALLGPILGPRFRRLLPGVMEQVDVLARERSSGQ